MTIDNNTIYRELKEIKSMLRKSSKICSWVNGQMITQLTSWDNRDKLRTARDNGFVEFKKEGKRMLYNLDSIHQLFLKK